jgi:hypothetical protein
MRIDDAALELWHLHRRPVLVVAALLVGLITTMIGVALVVRTTAGASGRREAAPPAASESRPSAPTPTAAATDVEQWNAMQPVDPATSPAYPAIDDAARQDPTAYARAFAAELFTRDYTTSRSDVIAWAQYEDSPLQSPRYPQADWSKVLVDSLTDITWDDAIDTPIPAEGPWLALRAERAKQAVSNIRVALDQQWEHQIAAGYQPPDRLATARDVTLTVVQRTTVAGHVVSKRFEVSLALQLGTSRRGGYGVAATNNYVVKEAG